MQTSSCNQRKPFFSDIKGRIFISAQGKEDQSPFIFSDACIFFLHSAIKLAVPSRCVYCVCVDVLVTFIRPNIPAHRAETLEL